MRARFDIIAMRRLGPIALSSRHRKERKLAAAALPSGGGVERSWWIAVLLAIAVFAAFAPALRNGFVFDDSSNLVDNLRYRGLSRGHLQWMFTTIHMGPYQPLSWLSYALDYRIWAMRPFGYHLTNLLLHAANAAAFYGVCAVLLSRVFAAGTDRAAQGALRLSAGLAAALWALHPLRVESVAWATERRDVLSGIFFLGTLFCYLRAFDPDESRRGRLPWRSLAWIAYLFSLLAKGIGITVPIVLLILDWYPLRRFSREAEERPFGRWTALLLEKVPFILLSVAAAKIGLSGQTHGSIVRQQSLLDGVAQAAYGLVFYFRTTFWPDGLSPLYEFPDMFNPLAARYLACFAAVLAATAALWALRRRYPWGLAVWLYFGATLGPVLGLIHFGPQLVADRYSYLSCMGWSVLAGGLIYAQYPLPPAADIRRFHLAAVVACATAAALAAASWRQTRYWRNDELLWSRALHLDPASSIAHNNLAIALGAQGRGEEAISHYRRAVELKPSYARAHGNLAILLRQAGRTAEAVAHARIAAAEEPSDAEARNNLGIALAADGKTAEAAVQYEEAARLDPNDEKPLYNLGIALAQQGSTEKAISILRRAVAVKPDYAEAYNNLGALLLRKGALDEAIENFRQAVRAAPQFVLARQNLAEAFTRKGAYDFALEQYSELLRVNPGDAAARYGAALSLARQGKKIEATQQARLLLENRPGHPQALLLLKALTP